MDSNTVLTMDAETSKRKKGITGSTLKLVAIITMLIDHTAATILDRTLITKGMYNLDPSNPQAVMEFMSKYGVMYYIDMAMRLIGRIAFPIFCFLLVEGFLHTHNKRKYAIRLAIFALVSEIPFDLAFHQEPFYFQYQNVFFTLLIGLLVMIGFQVISERARDKKWLPALAVVGAIAVGCASTYFMYGILQIINSIIRVINIEAMITLSNVTIIIVAAIFSIIAISIYGAMSKRKSLQTASVRFADLAILIAGMFLADVLKTDYSALGILTIGVMYGLRKSKAKEMLGGCLVLTVMNFSEITAFFDLILIRFYNGERGLNLKYVFYAFYPVHLFLLYMICYFMGIV